MKPKLFKHSLIAVSVTAALGISTSTMAATTSGSSTTDIRNIATASYEAAGVAQPEVQSNEVVVRVSESISFSLVANNEDGTPGDDANTGEAVAPEGYAVFTHTLTNTGNRSDNYTLNIANVAGDDADYDLANSTVSYAKYRAGDVPGTDAPYSSGSDIPVTVNNGRSLPLGPGDTFVLTVNAKTQGNTSGDEQNLELTATSALLTAPDASLTNTDNSVTKLPTYSIAKSITNGLNLNDANDTAAYRIVINNPSTAYAADGTDITITDDLPAGLLIATPLTASDVTVSGGATSGTLTQTDTGFELTGVDLPVDGSVTIDFTVQKDPNTALAANTINHATLTDDLDDDPTTDNTLIDSTDSTVENVSQFYDTNDTDTTNNTVADGSDGSDSAQPLLQIQRQLTLSNPTIREIAPDSGTSGQVTHSVLIKNEGINTEGDATYPITFTVTDEAGDALKPVTPFTVLYTRANGTTEAPKQLPVTVNGNKYSIRSNQFGLQPGDMVEVRYNMASTNADIGYSENTVVSLVSEGEGASTTPNITDTTTVQGLTLIKSQALDAACDGTADTAFSTSADPLAATQGQCVIYQIEANNTSSTEYGFDLQNVVISDAVANFSEIADYSGDANASTTTTGTGTTVTSPAAINTDSSAITTTVNPLVPQGSATMQFSVEIKTNR